MADKEPAGSKDESTPADDRVDPATPDDAEATGAESGEEPPEELPEELTDEPSNEDLAESGDDSASEPNGDDANPKAREPVTVGAAAAGNKKGAGKAARTESDPKSEAKAGKGRATRKRDGAAPVRKRTGPVTFVRESVGELRKVVYPTGQQLVNYFVVVLIFVLFVIAYVSVLDLAFGWAMFQIFA